MCEVALSPVLLMGAGVMVQGLLALRHGEAGFDQTNVLTLDVTLVETRYQTPRSDHSFSDAAFAAPTLGERQAHPVATCILTAN